MRLRTEVLGLSEPTPYPHPMPHTPLGIAPFLSCLHIGVLHKILFEKTVQLLCQCAKHCHGSFLFQDKGIFLLAKEGSIQ